MPVKTNMEEILLHDGRICVRKNIFDSTKETIIFIHGLSGSLSAWVKYEDAYKESYNILSYDLRGHGKSYRYEKSKDYKISCFTEDLQYLIDYFGFDKVILVSHSLGTLIAADYIIKYHEKVSKTIFLATRFVIRNKPLEIFLGVVIPFLKFLHRVIPIKSRMIHVDYTLYPGYGDFDILRTVADIRNTGLLTYLFCIKHTLDLDYEERLSKVENPTLIVHGEKDSVFNVKHAYSIHEKIKNSQLYILKKANHLLIFGNFQEIKKLITIFISS